MTTQAWRPIETAPKQDGGRILVNSNLGIFIAWWEDEAQFGRFESRPGWQVDECGDGWYSWALDLNQVTHWMPLPEPPQ